MKIKVVTKEHEYQGLYYNTVIEDGIFTTMGAEFTHKGKKWALGFHDYTLDIGTPTPIKSDGGSSSYYDRVIPEHYLKLMVETGIVKTEYLIDILFKNDFDFACTFKALVRAKGITEGAGKEGNTLDYELNKMDYYEARIKEKYGWRESD